MGQIPTILTRQQKIILAELSKNNFLCRQFYFTGGTALSKYYLQHRYSDDLDFFSEAKFNNQEILTVMDTWSKKYGFIFESRFAENDQTAHPR